MTPDDWIVVPNWARFQHYGTRRPVWIKVYTELGSRSDFAALTAMQRGVLLTVWLLYAELGGRVCGRDVARMCTASDRKRGNVWRTLDRLNHAGWIEVTASKPLALRYHRGEVLRTSPKKGASAGTNSPRASSPENNSGRPHKCPKCGIRFGGTAALAEHVYHAHDGPEPAHWIETERRTR